MHIHEKLYINGQWIESKGTDKIQVIDPSTEEICGEVPCGNDEDVNAAVAAAKEAFKTGKTIRELCVEQQILSDSALQEALDPFSMTKPQE